jgi:hypothetical protein
MSEISLVGTKGRHYKLSVNLRDYRNDPFFDPKTAPYRTISYKDDKEYVKIDSIALATVFNKLRVKDFKYYFFMLERLVRNDEPVFVPHREMRLALGDNSVQTVSQAIARLAAEGLIIPEPKGRGKYFINPAFAWKGNRLEYLDLGALEDRTNEVKI